MSEFSSKAVLITGSSAGIGAACAKVFAEMGACLSLTGRSEEKLIEVAKECKSLGAKEVLVTVADLTKTEDCGRVMKETISKFGELYVLVNNAGIASYNTLENFKSEEMDTIFDLHIKAAMLLTQLAIPHLEKTKGRIINMSSYTAGVYCLPCVYTTSKACLDHFTKTSALELAKKGIRVNAVSPAVVCTTLFRDLPNTDQVQELLNQQAKLHPLGQRLVELSDVTDAVLFLASDSAKMITGTILPVDGGRLLTGQ